MSKDYEYANVLTRKMEGHLKALGYNIRSPKATMEIRHKIQVLNYLRTVETSIDVIQHAVADTPVDLGAPKDG